MSSVSKRENTHVLCWRVCVKIHFELKHPIVVCVCVCVCMWCVCVCDVLCVCVCVIVLFWVSAWLNCLPGHVAVGQ